MLSNSVYDKLKHLAQVGLPAFGAFYFGLSQIWGFPAGEQVVGTVALVDTFLGVLLGVSSKTYNESDRPFDGKLVTEVDPSTGKIIHALELDASPEDIPDMDRLTFKVVHEGIA